MSRRRALVGATLLLVLAGGAVGAWQVYERRHPPDIHGSATVEFVPGDVPEARPRAAHHAALTWPTYGFDDRRLRYAPGVGLRPPYRRIWTFRGRVLLEFPPAVAHGRLYLPTFDGRFYALDAATGRPLWRHDSGRCAWASPALARGVLYQTFLNRSRSCDARTTSLGGELDAFDAANGHVRWRAPLGPSESSPLVADGLVFVGDWTGAVRAIDARTGGRRWAYRTGGPVKGSLALGGGRVFVGSYDGHVYALDARTGRLAWRASGQARLGGAGSFYSTPAVAYGRVYLGSTDGKVYSFGALSGKLRWSYGTGGFVYSSAAVWRKLVLVGSYDHSFYALDAATGALRWRFRANGPISGSATVLNGIVYFSTLAERTYALEARTGRLVWTFPDGKYSPVVSDGHRLYLVGYTRLYGMVATRR